MAYELHGLLAGNVSIVTGENIKPSYGGDDESFLRKVITPLYRVIEKVIYVKNYYHMPDIVLISLFVKSLSFYHRKPRKAKMGRRLTLHGVTMMI